MKTTMELSTIGTFIRERERIDKKGNEDAPKTPAKNDMKESYALS